MENDDFFLAQIRDILAIFDEKIFCFSLLKRMGGYLQGDYLK